MAFKTKIDLSNERQTKYGPKYLIIDGWNMNETQQLSIAHGLGHHWSGITSVNVMIINDGGNSLFPFTNYAGLIVVDAENVILSIGVTTFFNSVAFSNKEINRGQLVISYIPQIQKEEETNELN